VYQTEASLHGISDGRKSPSLVLRVEVRAYQKSFRIHLTWYWIQFRILAPYSVTIVSVCCRKFLTLTAGCSQIHSTLCSRTWNFCTQSWISAVVRMHSLHDSISRPSDCDKVCLRYDYYITLNHDLLHAHGLKIMHTLGTWNRRHVRWQGSWFFSNDGRQQPVHFDAYGAAFNATPRRSTNPLPIPAKGWSHANLNACSSVIWTIYCLSASSSDVGIASHMSSAALVIAAAAVQLACIKMRRYVPTAAKLKQTTSVFLRGNGRGQAVGVFGLGRWVVS
jgi:hypothetical protein